MRCANLLRDMQLNYRTRPDFSCSILINPDLSRLFFFKYLNSHHLAVSGPIPAHAGEPQWAVAFGVAARPGPIPAHAGEPSARFPTSSPTRAYPRSRGGTSLSCAMMPQRWGLSPLTRGNLLRRAGDLDLRGPIPAHAGEPEGAAPASHRFGAYPRSRGGTSFGENKWP